LYKISFAVSTQEKVNIFNNAIDYDNLEDHLKKLYFSIFGSDVKLVSELLERDKIDGLRSLEFYDIVFSYIEYMWKTLDIIWYSTVAYNYDLYKIQNNDNTIVNKQDLIISGTV
jgi:hypothetical protein